MRVSDLVPWRSGQQPPARRDDPFAAIQQEINRLFDDFYRSFDPGQSGNGGEREGSPGLAPWSEMTRTFTPQVNLSETDEAFEATVELPGMSEDEVDVELTRDGLVISGEKRTETSEDDDERDYYRRERRYGYFKRTIPLPAGAVERDACEATFANGVLTVRVPKRPEAQSPARRITVRRGD